MSAEATTTSKPIRPGQRVIVDSRHPDRRITGTVLTDNGGSYGIRKDGGAIAEIDAKRIISAFDPIVPGQTMRDNYANNATRKAVTR